jgi:hypothetical protein
MLIKTLPRRTFSINPDSSLVLTQPSSHEGITPNCSGLLSPGIHLLTLNVAEAMAIDFVGSLPIGFAGSLLLPFHDTMVVTNSSGAVPEPHQHIIPLGVLLWLGDAPLSPRMASAPCRSGESRILHGPGRVLSLYSAYASLLAADARKDVATRAGLELTPDEFEAAPPHADIAAAANVSQVAKQISRFMIR